MRAVGVIRSVRTGESWRASPTGSGPGSRGVTCTGRPFRRPRRVAQTSDNESTFPYGSRTIHIPRGIRRDLACRPVAEGLPERLGHSRVRRDDPDAQNIDVTPLHGLLHDTVVQLATDTSSAMRAMHHQEADVSDARSRPSMKNIREPEELARVFAPQSKVELAPRVKAARKSLKHFMAVRWSRGAARDTAGVVRSGLQ